MKRFLSLSLLSLALVSTVSAQSAEDILRAHIDAVGGEEAWTAVETAHAKLSVSVEIPQGIIVLDVEIWNVFPGHMLVEQTLMSAPEGIPDIGSTTYISPDEKWTDGFQGRQDLSGNEAALATLPNYEHPLDEARLLGSLESVEYSGQEDVKGKPAHVLTVTEVNTSKRFYDVESGLLVAVESTNPQVGMVRMHLSEYQEVNGLKQAAIQEGQMGGAGTQTLAFTLWETDIDLTPEQLQEMAKGDDSGDN